MRAPIRAGLATIAACCTMLPVATSSDAAHASSPVDTLYLTAHTSLVNGIGAHLDIHVNGVEAGQATLTNTHDAAIAIKLSRKVTTADQLDILFDNDSVTGRADRNWWIGSIASESGGTWDPYKGVVDNGDTWTQATDGQHTTTIAADGGIWGNSALRFAPRPASVTGKATSGGFTVSATGTHAGDHVAITWVQNGTTHTATTTASTWNSGQVTNWTSATASIINAAGKVISTVQLSAPTPAAAVGPWFLDTGNNAWWAWKGGQYASDPDLNRALFNIGSTVSTTWYAGVAAGDDERLRAHLSAAKAAGQVPQIALYGIPGRDCGSFSAGGQPDAASYRAWIDRVSAMVGTQSVLVTVEPDAISYCGWPQGDPRRVERASLLSYVGQKFNASNPNAALYLHMGDGSLGQNDAANAALAAGIQYYRGFAMNVATDATTATNENWADTFIQTMAARGVQNLHYLVDTSRNGRGTPTNPGLLPGVTFQACNNPNQAVGTRPTSHTDRPNADAWIWVKSAGYSDGVCHAGEPSGGVFFPKLAQKLVDNAAADHTITMWPLPANS